MPLNRIIREGNKTMTQYTRRIRILLMISSLILVLLLVSISFSRMSFGWQMAALGIVIIARIIGLYSGKLPGLSLLWAKIENMKTKT